MKSLLVFLCLFLSPGFAAGKTGLIKKHLLDIEAHVGRANLECDYDFFRKIEADEFFFTDPAGEVTTRAQDLAGEKDCKKHTGTYSLSDEKVLIYPESAVVSAIGTYEIVNAKGETVRRSNRFTDVFVKRKGEWLMVAGHSSALKTPASPSK
jgi:hypothetical protein